MHTLEIASQVNFQFQVFFDWNILYIQIILAFLRLQHRSVSTVVRLLTNHATRYRMQPGIDGFPVLYLGEGLSRLPPRVRGASYLAVPTFARSNEIYRLVDCWANPVAGGPPRLGEIFHVRGRNNGISCNLIKVRRFSRSRDESRQWPSKFRNEFGSLEWEFRRKRRWKCCDYFGNKERTRRTR